MMAEDHMEYRKSVLIIKAEDIRTTVDWGILEEAFDVVIVDTMEMAKEYFVKGQKKTDAILMYVNKDVEEAYSLVEYVNRDGEWCGVPVLVMAEMYRGEVEQKFLTLGVWNYMAGFCEIESIKLRLLNAIDRSMAKPLERLRYLADYDVLTGIYNKHKFVEETKVLLAETQTRKWPL